MVITVTHALTPKVSDYRRPVVVSCRQYSPPVFELRYTFYRRPIHLKRPLRGLNTLDHPQPPTPVNTDKTTSNSFVHSNIRKRRSKIWDMRWNWLRDKATHRDLKYYWAPGKENDADYYTKHFPLSYHRKICPNCILKGFNLTTLDPYYGDLAAPSHVRGCVFPWAGTNGYKRL